MDSKRFESYRNYSEILKFLETNNSKENYINKIQELLRDHNK